MSKGEKNVKLIYYRKDAKIAKKPIAHHFLWFSLPPLSLCGEIPPAPFEKGELMVHPKTIVRQYWVQRHAGSKETRFINPFVIYP